MASVAQLERQLAELDPANPDLRNRLHEIHGDVTREIQIIRRQYQARISAASTGGRRSTQLDKLETELDDRLSPYLALKAKVEEALGGSEGPGK